MKVNGNAAPVDALAACLKAAELDPDNSGVLSKIGSIYMNLGRRDEAMKWLKRSLKADPDNFRTYLLIANTMGEDRQEAERWMKAGAARTGGATPALFSGELDIPAWVRLDINEAADLITGRGINLMLQNYPSSDNTELLFVSGVLHDLAAARSLPYVEQAAEFSRLISMGRRAEYFAPRDTHCSARGYRLMAQRLADEMEKNNFIKRPPTR